ncbi:putative tetratricopeptide-like helical domain superfamily [Helianthus annuus]|nr:putative tetratricopeptide-like helical domain superfamily [Helianthus annuus]
MQHGRSRTRILTVLGRFGSIFNKYIEIELQLGNIDRCRKLYEKYLEWSPENCYAWSRYTELERSLSETERARALFELAIAQPALDMPELLWKAYINFEIAEGEFERTRQLYERLLDRTKHLKVWITYAKFEALPLKKWNNRKSYLKMLFWNKGNFAFSAPEVSI